VILLLVDGHHVVQVRHRQRAQNHRIHDAEAGVLAPMPMASVSTAVMVKPGDFHNWRTRIADPEANSAEEFAWNPPKAKNRLVFIYLTIAQFNRPNSENIGKWLISNR
jgi:deferrochelatase/peroxidase EfeB